MESLGDTLRGWTGFVSSGDAGQVEARVLNDPDVRRFRDRYPELDEHTLRVNLNRLYLMAKEAAHCRDCPGLERCPNDMQGHATTLTCAPSGGRWQIYDHKTPCAKWTSYELQSQIRRRITSFFVDEAVFGEAYSEQDMILQDPARAPAVSQVLAYVERTRREGLPKNGLYLMGDFGTGKTYLAGYLLQKLAKEGFTGVIVYMPEFVEDAKALMMEPQKLKETIGLMKETDLLVFDDIGAENLSPWVRDHVLGAILNYRMNRKPTFYTSNHDLDALERHFSFTHKDGEESHKGRRLMDRVRPFVDIVHVRGRNHRGG